MPTKLTLTLKRSTIEKAKQYAKRSNRSLSGLVEAYLEKITATEFTSEEIPEEFKGLFGSVDLSSEINDKQNIRNILAEKHRQ